MDLADIQLMQDRGNNENAIKGEAGLVLTEQLESEILDALSGYLKEMTETRSGGSEK